MFKNIKVGSYVYWKNPKKTPKTDNFYVGQFVIKQMNDGRTKKIASKVQEFDTAVQIKLAEIRIFKTDFIDDSRLFIPKND